MKLDDFKRFKGMMEMTTSTNDHEALTALRSANRLLEKEKLTWTRVLDRSVSVDIGFESAASAQGRTDEDEMEALFEAAMRNAKGSFLEMLEDIHEQWETRHSLTPRQREVVVEAAERGRGLR